MRKRGDGGDILHQWSQCGPRRRGRRGREREEREEREEKEEREEREEREGEERTRPSWSCFPARLEARGSARRFRLFRRISRGVVCLCIEPRGSVLSSLTILSLSLSPSSA